MYKFKLELNTLKNNKNLKIKGKGVKRGLLEQQAYDCWHTYEYLNQIYQYENNKYKNLSDKFKNLIKNKYFILLFLIKIFKIKSFLELGSSVFETINGLEFVKKNFFKFKKDLKKINYYGIEKSNFFQFLGKIIHFDYKIINPNLKNFKKVDLIYDRLVSSYAFNNEKQLSNFINKSTIAFMNLGCFKNLNSSSKNFNVSGSNGYDYTLFDLKKLKLKKDINGYYLFGKRNPNYNQVIFNLKNKKILRLDGFFLFCSEKNFQKFKTELKKLKKNRFIQHLNFQNFKNIKDLSNSNYYLF